MKKLLIIALLTLLTSPILAQTAPPKVQPTDPNSTADALIKSINDCFKKQDDACVVQLASKGIELYPTNDYFYYFRGTGFLGLNKYNEAIADETKAIEIYPKFSEAFLIRGAVYFRLDNYDKAVADFRQALEIKPDFDLAKKNLESALAKLTPKVQPTDPNPTVDALIKSIKDCDAKKDYACMVQLSSKGVELYPNNENFYFYRGAGFLGLEKYNEAIADFTKLLAINPKYYYAVVAYQSRGLAYDNLHNYDLAEADFKKELELDPGNKFATNNLEQIPGLKFEEYKRKYIQSDNDGTEKFVLVVGAIAHESENLTKMCSVINDYNSIYKITETNAQKIQQLLNSGELDKFPEYKKEAQAFRFNVIQEGRTVLNQLAVKYGCKLN